MRPVSFRPLFALAAAALLACSETTGPSPDTFTVNGVVVYETLQPQARALVLIKGHKLVTADEEGRFSVSGVKRPYDLVVAMGSEPGVLVYTGLTREDPLIIMPASQFIRLPHGARIEGGVSGGTGYSEPEDHRTSVLFESPETSGVGSVSGNRTYSILTEWKGSSTTTGSIHALQWQFDPSTGLPAEYKGYGKSIGIVLSAGTSLPRQYVHMGPIETGSISGSVTVPDGYTVSSKTLLAGFGNSPASATASEWEILKEGGSADRFNYRTPILPDATFALSARAVAGEAYGEVVKTGISAKAEGIVLNTPIAPVPIAPADGFADVKLDTRFVWSRMSSDAIYMLAIRYNGEGHIIPPPVNYYILTRDTMAVVPDLSAFRRSPYPGTSYTWEVHGWAPIGSMDEIAVETWFLPQGDRSTAASVKRSFQWKR
jgi:hypothetical protein